MEFKTFSNKLKENFDKNISSANCLFEVDVDKDEIWNAYLESYPYGSNEIFRERRENDCSACKSFVRNIGKAVVVEDNVIKTIWGFDIGNPKYQVVLDSMDAFVKSRVIGNVYHSKFRKVGFPVNRESTDDGIIEWHHLNVALPSSMVSNDSEGDYKGKHRTNKTTLQSSLDIITEDSILVVLELIASNSLYRGNEWAAVLSQFLDMKREYSNLSENEVNNWLWVTSFNVGAVMSKIKNHSIGTLLQNISEGMELDMAVKKYESIIAPENYKRPKPIFTAKMLERAEKDVTDMGYIDSLPRRFATVDDITVRDLLYVDRQVAAKLGVFDELVQTISDNPAQYDRVEEIEIEKFIANILPVVGEIEVMVENRHASNLASLIASKNTDSKTMFKWGNNFSWAYSGNMADSSMREHVKSAGGNITGDLRFSIQWNDVKPDRNDLDAHCIEPNGFEIYYGNNGRMSGNGGMLDVDIITPIKNKPAVENIVYENKGTMQKGVYKMFVHNYSDRGGIDGFRAEIEFDGVIHSFDYTKSLRQSEKVVVAEVTLSADGFSIKNMIASELQCRELWGITVNKFVHVSSICLSPNYWDGETGNKHYMFMLKDCINPDNPNGFFNEYLKNDLHEHRKVFEALGSKMRVDDCDSQLSGLGFSSTQKNSIIVRVKGSIDRIFKLKF